MADHRRDLNSSILIAEQVKQVLERYLEGFGFKS